LQKRNLIIRWVRWPASCWMSMNLFSEPPCPCLLAWSAEVEVRHGLRYVNVHWQRWHPCSGATSPAGCDHRGSSEARTPASPTSFWTPSYCSAVW
jgi:hypothetical protein